ncbi:MAG: hypothetical protein ACRCX2_22275 [Paraclostridium sp.]
MENEEEVKFKIIHAKISALESKFDDGLIDEDVFCNYIEKEELQYYMDVIEKISQAVRVYRSSGMHHLAESVHMKYFGEVLDE